LAPNNLQLHTFSIQVKTQLEAQTSMISISKEVEAIKTKEMALPSAAIEAATVVASKSSSSAATEANATKTSEEICALAEDSQEKIVTNQKEDK